jgi:hypothetical protein
MFFAESEYLLRDGIAGQSVIEAVDDYLSKRSPRDRIDARTMSMALGVPITTEAAQRVLESYQERALLRESLQAECPRCGTFAPVADLSQAKMAGDDYPCPGSCGGDLAADEALEEVKIFQLYDTPTPSPTRDRE